MSFRARLLAVCSASALLAVALVLGIVFSPQQVAQRKAGAPLVALPASARITSVDIFTRASDKAPLLTLKSSGPNRWEAESGGLAYPASPDRIAALLEGLRGMRRGDLVTTDPAKRPELGLDGDTAHMVLLHAEGAEVALLVGKRAASGDEEYVMARGEPAAYLTRSSVGILLDQDSAYWYDLRVLPEDIQGGTILGITVGGSSVKDAYSLERGQGAQGEWRIRGRQEPVNPLAASAMADRLAELSGLDFAKSPPAARAGAPEGFQVTITAINGERYVLRISPGAEPERLFLTTSWSPWTYVVDSRALSRAVFPLSDLLGQR